MNIILDNQKVTLKLSKQENENFGAYLPQLFKSNKVNGILTYDNETETYLIQCFGANENIYSALMQVQDETEQNYYTIE